MDSQGRNVNSQMEENIDADEVPAEYLERLAVGGRGKANDRVHNTNRNNPKFHSTGRPRGAKRHADGNKVHNDTTDNESSNFLQRMVDGVGGMLGLSPTPHRPTKDLEQQRQKRENYERDSAKEVCGSDDFIEQPSHRADIDELERSFQEILHVKEREWEARERQNTNQINNNLNEIEKLQARLRQSQFEKAGIQQKYETFIRKQQEASFRQMEDARWRPTDERKVMDDLDRLKRSSRVWAKAVSIQELSLLSSLEKRDYEALMQCLAPAVLFKNNELPKELFTTAKSPMLLLNALLAHSVYASFFRSPFFFLSNIDSDGTSSVRILEEIYERAQMANPKDAHLWRSDTLRLHLPPLRNDTSEAEKHMRSMTEQAITQVADQRASDFLISPARHLMKSQIDSGFTNKLKTIYTNAAETAYKLWTRRTAMRYLSLHEIGSLHFDAASPYFEPEPLVRYEDHEDELKGKKVILMVHPLLTAHGTDEAEDYDKERVWTKGVVWLDSSRAPEL